MKKLMMLLAVVCLAAPLHAQEEEQADDLYLLFEYMRVEEGQGGAYLETEEFWAGIHKQRALAGETLGWDLWSLQPSGTDQGYQYLTVNLFGSLESMMRGTTGDALLAHAKKAHPDMPEEEVAAQFNATVDTRDLAVQVFLEQVDYTTGGPQMEEGTVALITAAKAKDSSYERMESEIFKPWHQQMVDAGAKASWGLARVILPGGSDRHASHLIFNMFKDISQYASAGDYEGPEPTPITSAAAQKGLATRDLRSVTMATLVKKVRP